MRGVAGEPTRCRSKALAQRWPRFRRTVPGDSYDDTAGPDGRDSPAGRIARGDRAAARGTARAAGGLPLAVGLKV